MDRELFVQATIAQIAATLLSSDSEASLGGRSEQVYREEAVQNAADLFALSQKHAETWIQKNT